MKSQVKTLLLYAPNIPNVKRIFTDTLREHLRLDMDKMPKVLRQNRFFYGFFKQGYRTLSYVMDWYDAFLNSSQLRLDTCNINNLLQLLSVLRRIQSYELIIILHSAAGDHVRTLRWIASFLKDRKGKLVICFGNEYMLMPEKIRLAKSIDADFIVTQLPLTCAQWLYSECSTSRIIAAPAALNPAIYRPLKKPRSIDLGFRGSDYPLSIGDNRRNQLISQLSDLSFSMGLRCDMRYEALEREAWAEFLNSCHGIPGAESGTYFLEKDDHTQKAIAAYIQKRPNASFQEIYQLFFKNYKDPISGKAISSRHFEPIGTFTCQLLLEGDYNGILRPEEHYIAVKTDLSNLDDAIRRFKDPSYRSRITQHSYEYVMAGHTYAHRVESILSAVL